MKKLKKILCVFLVVLMCLTSAPLSGFVGLEWPEWRFSAEAAIEDELPDNAVDYSNLTTNQYIAKVILNSNYIGAANGWEEGKETIVSSQYRYYLNPYKVSFARILSGELEKNASFMNSVDAWKVLTFDPSEAYENYLDKKDYYVAILYNILDEKMQDSKFLDALNCSTNATILSLSKSVSGIMEKSYDIDASKLAKVDISDMSESQFNDLLNQIGETDEMKGFYKQLGDNLGNISDVCSGCSTIYDVVENISMYSELVNVTESVKAVLKAICQYVPEENIAMQQAAEEVYETCSEQMSQAVFGMMKAGEQVFNKAFSAVVSSAWKTCLGAASSSIVFGQAIGKAISNFCFSTDAIIEQYQALTYVCEFEEVMVHTVGNLGFAFRANESSDNADAFLQALEMLLSVYTLGYEYSYTFANTAKNKGLANKITSFFGDDDTVEKYRESTESMKNSVNLTKRFLTTMEGYRYHYEYDAPSAYIALFEPPAEENSSSLSYAYSPTVLPLYVEPVINEETGNCAIFVYRHENDNTLTITMCNPNARGNIVIPKDIGGVAVRKIASNAFKNCDKITDITMNSTLRTIESNAFYGCENLRNVTLNDGLQTIGSNAFGKTALTSITIPKTVTSMGQSSGTSVFSNTDTLKTVIFEYGMLKIPSHALYNCKSVTSVVIPSGITEIGYYAFNNCESLTSISLPDSLQTIDSYAFYNCTGLTALSLPNSLQTINGGAFTGCTGFTSITMPENLQTISGSAFYGCTNLSKVYLNDGLKTIGSNAFGKTALTSITIPKTVTSMGQSSGTSVFSNTDTLKTVIFEYGMLKIPSYALYNCKSVTSVSIPYSISDIDYYAFNGCTGITKIYIPISVTKINSYAFSGCTNITDVHYVGNEESWNKITIGSNNEPLTNANIHYNYNHSAHTYTSSITKQALCLETGIMTYSCFCGDSYTETIPAKGHQMGEYVLVKPATCEEKGEEKSFCELCGTFVSRDIDFADHVDENEDYRCDLCLGWIDVIIASGECGIDGDNLTWKLYSMGDLIIDGVGAMKNYKSTIYTPWYDYGSKIENIYVYEEVTSIGDNAFSGFNNLQEVYFYYKPHREYSITYIGQNAFSFCHHLKGDFSDGFYIPDSVTYIGKDAFSYCSSLEGFDVDINNKYYSNDENGVLYNKDKTMLIVCPMDIDITSFVVPDTVTTICEEAFYSCEFSSITIPASVITIGEDAFRACYELNDVYYQGSEDKWSNIEIADGNEDLLNSTIHFLEIPADEHTPKTVTIPATCTIDGIKYVICEDCGETIGTPEVIKATGHKSSDWIVEKEPTPYADGKKVKKCTVCSVVLEEAVIPKKATASDDGVIMEYAPGDYNGTVKLQVEESFDGSAFNLIDTQTGATQSFIYDIKMTVNGKEVQPIGNVTIKIPLPNGFKSDSCYIYYVNTSTGNVERIPTTYENGYLVFETDHFSYYAIVDIHEHSYGNTDAKCKDCGFDRTEGCSCNCHKNGIAKFFFNFILFFQKIFKKNQVCSCGIAHY